ncbi:MAG: SPOR domain-containing protein [Prevotella sp.]|jgi:cell division protein FtsN
MKKYLLFCATACAVMAFTSCGTNKESAYKKAYEKAMAQESQSQATQPQTEEPVVTPLTEKPATDAEETRVNNATVRSENVTLINGSGLKAYSVVVGSFSLKANAEGLQNTLKQGGYDAQIAYNSNLNMYRVIASTYDDKASAVNSRDAIRTSQYNPKGDAWLLYKQ